MPGVRNRPLALAIAALVGLGMTGCSDDGDEDSGAATTTTAVESGSGEEDAEANTVSIDMKDYTYAISGELKGGTSTVALKNSGTELHMAAFWRLHEGKTLADVQAALQSEDDSAFASVVAQEVDSPGTVLSPGQSEEITTGFLGAGSYAVICFLPTADEDALHFAKGMIGTFAVAAGDVEATAANADAEYTLEDGKIDGPRTLKSGENTLQMTSAGEGPHEFLVMKKRRPDATYEDIDKFFTDALEGDTPPPKGYADTSPAIIAASSFDVVAGETIFLTTDLEPGQYLIGCALDPDADEGTPTKPHTGEILEVTVT